MKNIAPEQISPLRRRAKQIAAALPPVRWDSGGMEARAPFESAMRRLLCRGRAVGATLVLMRGEATEVFCYGDARHHPRTRVTPQTCFRVASVSKMALALGALSLCEAGLVTLDGGAALGGVPLRHPRFPDRPVTLRMLLTHTAGLRDTGPYAAQIPRANAALPALLADPASWGDAPPGEAFHYSNFSAGVAGCLMEQAAGKPLDALMRERLFDPLGMRAAYDVRQIAPPDDLADGYRVLPFPLPPQRRYDARLLAAAPSDPFDPLRDYLAAPGRMLTDAAGAAKLLRLLCQDGDTPVLRAASLREMRANQAGRGGIGPVHRALGCAFLPAFAGEWMGHQGVAYGMCAEFFFDPRNKRGVALMSSGMDLFRRREPFVAAGFDLLALGVAALR